MLTTVKPAHIVLLSGGSGSRLWPLSNDARSKQFLKVLRNEEGEHVSMVQRTFEQIQRALPESVVTVATSASQVEALRGQVTGNYEIVVEPERRDTAPAILLACKHLEDVQNVNRDDTVVVMPIDSYVDDAYFSCVRLLNEAVQQNAGDIVLLGVEPTYPSEKYGYIVPTRFEGAPRSVSRFEEKPTESRARSLIDQGALWNCGVFGFRLSFVLDLIGRYGAFPTFSDLRMRYEELPKNSFDYEVVEHAERIAVVPYSGSWKDLGTWNTLTEEMRDAVAGRVYQAPDSCDNVHVINELDLPLVVAGLSDAVVVATPDGVLVSSKEASAHIKATVKEAAEDFPLQDKTAWGSYRYVDLNAFSCERPRLVKEVSVCGGMTAPDLGDEAYRGLWTFVQGEGEFSLDSTVHVLRVGETVVVPAGSTFSITASEDVHALVTLTDDAPVS